ncbi:NPL4 family-domain-containing protein [Phycomyces blakesleeanus]|uniref:Nuclear protein localization protein 4 n=1 Tax=Phycomyces blakesleeanus TaxID=4837 RepID=A0ABR3BH02_PHYBL
MLLRIRSKEGMIRVQVDPKDTFATLGQKIAAELKLDDVSTLALGEQPNSESATPISHMATKTISEAHLQHGSMLFVSYKESSPPSTTSTTTTTATTTTAKDSTPTTGSDAVKQDDIDNFLEKERGLIKRSKDTKFCRHGAHAMCDYCMPLEPYDAGYLEENKIKHMSFHSYLRKIDAAQQTKAPSATTQQKLPLLEEAHYTVKVPCTGAHAAWPEGICTKCQPSAITLQRQTYRMVDHVEFSSASVVDNFLNAWRKSGCQRFGYLYGRYEPYLDVPLGIKAVVEAIVEPTQEDHVDGISVAMPWAEEEQVNKVAAACGLVQVGMVFTDLVDDGSGTGKVLVKRHGDSYFLSSQECLFAAEMQRRHPNITRQSATGHFGSKFVSCVISGDLEGNVDVSAYQVSNSLVAMHEAGIVEASRKPSVMRVKESIPHERYVPEVFYKYKNKYNVVVKESAKPTFPVEYLLVNVTHGFPQIPSPLFQASGWNELAGGQSKTAALAKYLSKTDGDLAQSLNDFNVLCAIKSTNVLSDEEFGLLCSIATQPGQSTFELEHTSGWKTLKMSLGEPDISPHYSQPSSHGSGVPAAVQARVACRYCTYSNPGGQENCDMCGLPLSD